MASPSIPLSVFESSVNGYTDILGCLLKAAPGLANAEYKGALPLIAASSKGQAEAVQVLLEHGAQVDAQDKTEESALIAASARGHTQVVEVLLAYGASVDLQGRTNEKSALNAASTEGKLGPIKALISHGAQVDLGDINGWSPLYVAAMKQHVGVVKYLLQHGANPNTKDITGACPLIKASSLGYTQVVKTLLEGGVQVDILNDRNCTALCTASLMGFTEIADLLLEHGAQVNLENERQQSALASACYSGHVKVVQSLIKHGAKDSKLVAVLIAILMDRREIIELFSECGSQVHPSAAKLARTLNRNALLRFCITKINEVTMLTSPFTINQQEDKMEEEELMDMQKLILETVNDLQLKSMASFRSGNDEFPVRGEGSLKLGVIMREFMPLYLAGEWQSIGALLDIPSIQLQAIKQGNSKAINCMREMLDAWLKREPPPTWERLIEAVEILDEAKAKHLRNKFC